MTGLWQTGKCEHGVQDSGGMRNHGHVSGIRAGEVVDQIDLVQKLFLHVVQGLD